MFSGVLALIAIPLILQRVPPNRLYGVRTAKTVADPEVWYRANTFGGWAMLSSAIATSLLAVFGVPSVLALLLPLTVALLGCILYIARMEE